MKPLKARPPLQNLCHPQKPISPLELLQPLQNLKNSLYLGTENFPQAFLVNREFSQLDHFLGLNTPNSSTGWVFEMGQ